VSSRSKVEQLNKLVDAAERATKVAAANLDSIKQLEERGDRHSAAIATLKLLGFDLAAIVASIEGEGAFPRFLVHDGPREADMALDVYERLFLFTHELEKCFGEKEPGFQYIIATTTTPPDKFVARDAPAQPGRQPRAGAEQRGVRGAGGLSAGAARHSMSERK